MNILETHKRKGYSRRVSKNQSQPGQYLGPPLERTGLLRGQVVGTLVGGALAAGSVVGVLGIATHTNKHEAPDRLKQIDNCNTATQPSELGQQVANSPQAIAEAAGKTALCQLNGQIYSINGHRPEASQR